MQSLLSGNETTERAAELARVILSSKNQSLATPATGKKWIFKKWIIHSLLLNVTSCLKRVQLHLQ